MPSASTSKLIRLVDIKSKPNGHLNGKRLNVEWMDVSDEEERRKKFPRKNMNGTATIKGHVTLSLEKRSHRNRKSRGGGSSSASASPVNQKHLVQEQRKQLPIAQGRDALIQEIRENDVTVLLGETGSGKTTQIPQYVFESGIAGNGIIAVTQPRRVAATSLATRVAAEQDVSLGSRVGYSVRFDEKYSPDTRIKFLTDGMIMRELMSDPLLSHYSVVIVDEAHERTLRTDLLLSNLKAIQTIRTSATDVKGKAPASELNPLKIIIMSATLDAEKFSKFFHNAKIVYVRGRQHPVTIYHTANGQTDYVDSALRTFFQVHTDQAPGDVLIFLPGQEDIETLEKSIQLFANRLPPGGMAVITCSMYAAQTPEQNLKVFSPSPANTRKCILATNIAETSITIPGVRYVIDTGKHKEKRFLARDTGGGFDTLLTRDISQSSAMQRAGRAGREGQGFCYRLYTEEAFTSMKLSGEPEILRVNLASSLLEILCLGQNLEELDLMDNPDSDSITSALKTLYLLGAINTSRQLTILGREMATLPLEPTHARAVLASKEYGCTLEVLDIISVLSATPKLFFDTTEQRDSASEARAKFRHGSGDHLTILNAVRAYQEIAASETKGARKDWCRKHFLNERALVEAGTIRNQLRQTCARLQIDWSVSCGDNDEAVLKSLGHGFVQNSALLQPDGVSYKQIIGPSIIKIHPGSTLCDKKVPAIIYDELTYTTQIYARGVSSIRASFFTSTASLNLRAA